MKTCIDCKGRICRNPKTKRCRKCADKFIKGANSPCYRKVLINCSGCGQAYSMHRYRLKIYKLHFCSRACKTADKRTVAVPQKKFSFPKGHRPWNVGITHSEETRKKLSIALKGKTAGAKNRWWKGGITPLINKIKSSGEYKEWQRTIMKRDLFTCRKCKVRGGRLTAHHLTSFAYLVNTFAIKILEEAKACVALWNIQNGVTLCESCHKETPNYSFRAVKVPIDTNIY